MTSNAGGIKVVAPASSALVVTLTTAAGTPVVYSDVAVTTTIAQPITVSAGATQAIYVVSPGAYTLSVTKGGVEGANPRTGTTLSLDLGPGEQATYDYTSAAGFGWTTGGSSAGTAETVNTVAASGAAATIPDPTTATINKITLTAACTLTFPTAAAGKSFSLTLIQDGTGSRLVTWPGTVKWQGGVAPILSTVAAKVDALSFLCVDGTNWYGFIAGLDIR